MATLHEDRYTFHNISLIS